MYSVKIDSGCYTKIWMKMVVSKMIVTFPEKYKYFISVWVSKPTTLDKTLTNITARLFVEEFKINVNPNVNAF